VRGTGWDSQWGRESEVSVFVRITGTYRMDVCKYLRTYTCVCHCNASVHIHVCVTVTHLYIYMCVYGCMQVSTYIYMCVSL